MSDFVPAIRSDVMFDVHVDENGIEQLMLSCTLGLVDSPILVDTNLLGLFEIMDGSMTWDEFRVAVNLENNEAQWLRLRAFIGQLDQLGFMDTPEAGRRMSEHFAEWDASLVRPAAFAGSSYPEDESECRAFFEKLLGVGDAMVADKGGLVAMLAPHLDFHVAGDSYQPWRGLSSSDAELFVFIGTSHYANDHQVILTEKHFDTPMGIVPTDVEAVRALQAALVAIDDSQEGVVPVLAPTDRAHRGEHSLEFHAVLLRHVLGNRDVAILPILVASIDADDPRCAAIAATIAHVVAATGKKAMVCISGDLAHVGHRFGDEEPAKELLEAVRANDTAVLALLERGQADAWRRHIERQQNRYRICGAAPVWFGLRVAERLYGELAGRVDRRHVWHDEDTNSAVSVATVTFVQSTER